MKKNYLPLLFAAFILIFSAACQTQPAPSKTESAIQSDTINEPLHVAFFMFENSNTFTTYIRKGMESYGKQHNVIVESFDGKSDQSTQTDAITTALAKGQYDVIVVNLVDSGAGTIINNLAKASQVPVIFADRAPDLVGGVLEEYEAAYYVGLDWSDPGKVQAEMVYEDWKANKETIDKNGDGILQYVLLQGNVAQQNAIYRTNAIHDLMAKWNEDETMRNIELDIQDGNWSSDKGKDVMDVWNVKFGDQIEAILCNNDTMAMGAVESLKTAGAFDSGNGPKVYGINGIPDVWELIEQGYMAGTVLTSPYREAKTIIDMAVNLHAKNDPLLNTTYQWGEFGKDVRIDDIAIRIENIDIAKEDFSFTM